MVTHNTYTTVANDDYLQEGYYNGIRTVLGDVGVNGTIVPPIGSVIAWFKDLTGVPATLPAGWVECDGSTISDSDSPLDGVTIPDLNGDNRFLRGADTSGTTGGTTAHTHSDFAAVSSQLEPQGGGVAVSALTISTATNIKADSEDHIPPYYATLWIMRIK